MRCNQKCESPSTVVLPLPWRTVSAPLLCPDIVAAIHLPESDPQNSRLLLGHLREPVRLHPHKLSGMPKGCGFHNRTAYRVVPESGRVSKIHPGGKSLWRKITETLSDSFPALDGETNVQLMNSRSRRMPEQESPTLEALRDLQGQRRGNEVHRLSAARP